jgi:hypothetical protein
MCILPNWNAEGETTGIFNCLGYRIDIEEAGRNLQSRGKNSVVGVRVDTVIGITMNHTKDDSNIDERVLASQHRAVFVENEFSVGAPELVECRSKLSGCRGECVTGC